MGSEKQALGDPPIEIRGGRWVVTGELPEGITMQDTPDGGQLFVDANGDPQPSCFGVYWEATGPESADCLSCDMESLCRQAVVHFHLPIVAAKIAATGETKVHLVAKQLDVHVDAARALLDQLAQREAGSVARKAKRPRRSPPGRSGAKEIAAENPILASFAAAADDEAIPSAIRRGFALSAESWDLDRQVWLRPWEAKKKKDRERQKSVWIERLAPGMVLWRFHAERWWKLRVAQFGYQVRGVKYPTLREATRVIREWLSGPRPIRVKTLGIRGVVQWWRLPELLVVSEYQQELEVRQQARKELARLRREFWRDD